MLESDVSASSNKSELESTMDQVKQDKGASEGTGVIASKVTASQRIEKLREAVVRKNKAPSPALYKAYKNMIHDTQKAGNTFSSNNLILVQNFNHAE